MGDDGFQRAVLAKLLFFATLVAVVPIATYFVTIDRLWHGSTTWAAISAVVSANIVLIGYVIVAFREDAGDSRLPAKQQPEIPSKKQQ
ncbi:vacuolar ATPase assembly integral membrane protein vma21 [Naganishia albida]|nr:vacuolar ATPase assembly integral membrane protein vma21 [Naganishia albida]